MKQLRLRRELGIERKEEHRLKAVVKLAAGGDLANFHLPNLGSADSELFL